MIRVREKQKNNTQTSQKKKTHIQDERRIRLERGIEKQVVKGRKEKLEGSVTRNKKTYKEL